MVFDEIKRKAFNHSKNLVNCSIKICCICMLVAFLAFVLDVRSDRKQTSNKVDFLNFNAGWTETEVSRIAVHCPSDK